MNGDAEAAPVLARMVGGRRSDRALVRAAQRGSSEAVEELFRRYWPRAHRVAALIVHDDAAAEDIAQEAFLASIRALDRFDRARPFGPWIHRIVANRAIDFARSRSLRREVDPAAAEAVAAPSQSGGPLPEDLMSALAELQPEHRAVVVLRYVLELTPGEIAETLEMPRGTVNSRLRRGLDRLSRTLEESA